MRRLCTIVAVLALVGLTSLAQAAEVTGSTIAGPLCACGTQLNGSGFCFQDQACNLGDTCAPGGGCPAGRTCVTATCCGFDICLLPCPQGPACSNPEVCGTYTLICEEGGGIPTVSEWGLIILTGLLLAAGAFLIWRRSASPAAA